MRSFLTPVVIFCNASVGRMMLFSFTGPGNCSKNLFTTPLRYAIMYRAWGCSSAGRARQSHCRGQGFEPPHLHRIVSHAMLLFDEIALQIAKGYGIVYVTIAHIYVMSRSSRSKLYTESSRVVQGYIVRPNSPVSSKRE